MYEAEPNLCKERTGIDVLVQRSIVTFIDGKRSDLCHNRVAPRFF